MVTLVLAAVVIKEDAQSKTWMCARSEPRLGASCESFTFVTKDDVVARGRFPNPPLWVPSPAGLIFWLSRCLVSGTSTKPLCAGCGFQRHWHGLDAHTRCAYATACAPTRWLVFPSSHPSPPSCPDIPPNFALENKKSRSPAAVPTGKSSTWCKIVA